MNAEHRQILREKRLLLERTIIFDDTLIKYLRQYKLFNQFMWEDIKSISDVIDLLPTRGPKAFENFIEILKKAKYVDEADFLEKSRLPASMLPFDSSLFYKISSNPLGYCLIINNVKFEKNDQHKKDENRYGSDKDAKSLCDFFKRHNFDAFIENNLQGEIMLKTIEQFSERDFYSVDSMILIILSHGGQKDNKDIIFGTDWKYIYKDDIYDFFSNKKPHLQLKPKIFIFNACRGEELDYGELKTPSKQSLDSVGHRPNILSTHSDVVIVNSCLPNNVSVLDHEEGSFFISTLVSVLNEYHKVYHLETMIKVVNWRLEEKVSREYRVVQAAQIDCRGLKKNIMLCRSDMIKIVI